MLALDLTPGTCLEAEILPEFSHTEPGDRSAWFALRLSSQSDARAAALGAVTSNLDLHVRAAPGFLVATMPGGVGPCPATETSPLARVALGPLFASEERLVPFELEWTDEHGPREYRAALVTLRVRALGAAGIELLELPAQLRVAPERGAMNPAVTRAVCELMAGRALHLAAAAGVEPPVSARLLADATSWIGCRARAARLSASHELAPTLHLLAAAQALYERAAVDVPSLVSASFASATRDGARGAGPRDRRVDRPR